MYSISIRAKNGGSYRLTSSDIVKMLDESVPEQARAADAIRDIEKYGIKYSYQDFDVLSRAADLVRT